MTTESNGAIATPLRCPRHAKSTPSPAVRMRVSFADLHREPFRIFFPVAVLAGLIGVSLWPLVLGGWMTDYPGVRHARLMVQGFFGGFIFGFLGTSLPRFLEVRPLAAWEAFPLLGIFVTSVITHTAGATNLGDGLFVVQVLGLGTMLAGRWNVRLELPPPGFVLVAVGFACALAGIGISALRLNPETFPVTDLLAKLLGYHAFLLLCILGAGGFLLPRFLGVGVRRKFPGSRSPTPEWMHAMGMSMAVGLLIVVSFLIEANGWPRSGTLLRAVLIVAYLWHEMPLERLRFSWHGVQWLLIVGLACVPLGVLASGWLPGWRVALSHLELIGGFGLITAGVATRVVFGHSGGRERLERFHPWLTIAAVLMLVGMASRISGDFLPKILVTHYLYGAIGWGLGLLIWAGCVLPRLLRADPEA